MDSTTLRIDINDTPEIWLWNLTIDHIHPSWHPGARPIDWREFKSRKKSGAAAPVKGERLGR